MKLPLAIKTITTSKATVSLLKGNIIEVQYSDNEIIEVDDSLAVNSACLKLVEKTPFAVLIITGMFTNFSAEARELAARNTLPGERVATALVADTLSHKLVGNFYLKFNKPELPTRMFESRDEAFDWLRKALSDANKNQG